MAAACCPKMHLNVYAMERTTMLNNIPFQPVLRNTFVNTNDTVCVPAPCAASSINDSVVCCIAQCDSHVGNIIMTACASPARVD